jgi:HAMP domain-containing protein
MQCGHDVCGLAAGVWIQGALGALAALGMVVAGTASGEPPGPLPGAVLRHVVLFQFKETSTPDDVARIVTAFRGLPARIPQIKAFEWGTDVSPEGKANGFTHCFFVTFATEADRDAYLPHPAHEEFVAIVGPHVANVCVVDYWTRP